MDLLRHTVGNLVFGLAGLAGGGRHRGGGLQGSDDELGDLIEFVGSESAGGQCRGADAYARGVPGAVRVSRNGVAVGDHAGVQQRGLGLTTGQPEARRDVEQVDVSHR